MQLIVQIDNTELDSSLRRHARSNCNSVGMSSKYSDSLALDDLELIIAVFVAYQYFIDRFSVLIVSRSSIVIAVRIFFSIRST